MDLQRALGQLFLLGFHGEDVFKDHPIFSDIQKRNLGGVILFDRLLAKNLRSNNIIAADQVKKLTSKLQNLAGNRLFIGVDQEGGKVCRFTAERGFPTSVAAAELGKRNDLTLTQIHARATAGMLESLGINVNLAPVVDLNICPDNPIIGALGRSFSSNPDQVVQHAEVWITAHKSRHIISCLKHFPGHGSSRDDSHQGFVEISETWSKDELRPFAKLIDMGLADLIMTGHLFSSPLDPNFPATLSQPTITGLLREQLGYRGIVITDDIQMKAISDHYKLEEVMQKAFSAGVDMIVIGNNISYDPDILNKCLEALISCIRKGSLKEEQLAAAVNRVQTLKDMHFTKKN